MGRKAMDTDGPGPAGNDDLAERLSELARTLQGEDNVQATLDAIVDSAVDTVPGAKHAGISVVERRRTVYTQAATDELVHRVDQAQYDTGQGPCLDAIYEDPIVRVPDMGTEQRWPDFIERALDLGVHSMLSFRLYVRQDDLGGLNLYSPDEHAFDEGSEHVGL